MSHEQIEKLVSQAAAHWQNNDAEASMACSDEVLKIDPNQVDGLSNKGTALWALGRTAEAREHYLKVINLMPSHMSALLNLGTLCHDDGDLEGALRYYEKALELRPMNADVLWRKGIIQLAQGDYLNGWANYEAGLGQETIRGKLISFKMGQWDGNYCNRLVIWHEQGLGDTLQFVRYAWLCKQRANKVFVLCPQELIDVVKTCPWVDGAITTLNDGDFDAQISIMSLPYLFQTTVPTVPAPVPYLFAKNEDVLKYKEKMNDGKLKVGLVWQGNPRKHAIRFRVIDSKRSFSLDTLQPLLEMENVEFYSLQKGESEKQANEHPNIINFMGEVNSFMDTAAVIANLDLVISVDTSVVHLAGAMGKPVWVLSRADACWRWLRNQPSNPWYPTARVFGQPKTGDWNSVISDVKEDLEKLVK